MNNSCALIYQQYLNVITSEDDPSKSSRARGMHRQKKDREEVRKISSCGYRLSGRKCVTSQIRLRNLCLKFTGVLVSPGVGASHVSLRIKHWSV